MKEYSEHPFYVYKRGLNILINMIDRKDKYYFSALTLQQRLNENISFSELFGNTEILKADRAEIIYSLNKLSLEILTYSFNEICEFDINDIGIIPTQPGLFQSSSIELLPLSAWIRFPQVASNYDNLFKKLLHLIKSKDYDEAKKLFWLLLYYTGTREVWRDRITISKEMFKLSKKEKDYESCGSILAKGEAYRLISIGDLQGAEMILNKALPYLQKAGAYSETGKYFDLLAEIYEEKGNAKFAIDYYKEARKRLTGIDEYKAHLKERFVRVKNDNLKSVSRIDALELLSESFGSTKSYREAMVKIELAKSLYILKDTDALLRVQEAYDLLKNKIFMPRNTYKAEKLLKTIRHGEPLITK